VLLQFPPRMVPEHRPSPRSTRGNWIWKVDGCRRWSCCLRDIYWGYEAIDTEGEWSATRKMVIHSLSNCYRQLRSSGKASRSCKTTVNSICDYCLNKRNRAHKFNVCKLGKKHSLSNSTLSIWQLHTHKCTHTNSKPPTVANRTSSNASTSEYSYVSSSASPTAPPSIRPPTAKPPSAPPYVCRTAQNLHSKNSTEIELGCQLPIDAADLLPNQAHQWAVNT
jgi:hypothetical protein